MNDGLGSPRINLYNGIIIGGLGDGHQNNTGRK